jgi:hypothetical protein
MWKEPKRLTILSKILQEFFLASTEIHRDGGGIIVHLSKAKAMIELLEIDADADYDALAIKVTGYRLFDRFLALIKKWNNYKDLKTDTLCVADMIEYYRDIQQEMNAQVIANLLKYGQKKLEVVKEELESIVSGKTEKVMGILERYKDEVDDYTNSKKNLVLTRLCESGDFNPTEQKELKLFFTSTIQYPIVVRDSRTKATKFRVKYSKTEYSEKSFPNNATANKFLTR